MVTTDFIVAIELGSSKITGIAGKKNPDGSIQILAVASEKSSDFIRKGLIYNLDKTAQSLKSIIKRLESNIKVSIGRVYIGVGGQSLRTTRNTEVRHLEEETKISQGLIDSIMDSNREVPIIDQEILEVAPQEYKVGINLIADPVGVPTDHIEGRFLNIISRNSLKQNIDKCFMQANIEIADYITAPIALADSILTNAEKRSGCMLVDFGADTTTVSIYKNNILRHLAVIPLGGTNITKDICSQQIEEEEAEELKIKYGSAYTEPLADDEEAKKYSLDDKCSIDAELLEDIIEARVNEILSNVWHQVVLSGYADKLLSGAIITGGAANLRNMEEAFTKISKIDKVRVAKDTQITVKGAIELKKDGAQTTILSLLAAGKENCILPKVLNETPVNNVAKDLFGDDQETSEEKRIRLAQEASAKKAEEELRKKRILECSTLIATAIELKDKQDYKGALDAVKKADALNISEKKDQLKTIEAEIKKLKKGQGWMYKVGKKISILSDEILSEDK